jgi:hypothetical protein
MSKAGHPNWLSGLRNYTTDEGRPLEPACTELDSNHLPLLRSKGRGGERSRKRPGSEIRVR